MIDINKILKILPHRYPILLLDRITEINPFKSIEGYKNVTINEEVFLGHFPGTPVYPGVMIIEGMAQTGAALAFVSTWGYDFGDMKDKIVYFMGIDRAKFRAVVSPGDRLFYKLNVLKVKGKVWIIDAKAFVDDKLVAEAELKAMLSDRDNN